MANDMSPSIGRLFELTTFLEGPVTAWGVFEDRFGRLKRRFRVDLVGRWQGGSFVITEDFAYDDGQRERRVWTVDPKPGGRFVARSPDCIGEATGESTMDVSTMRYKFRLKLKDRELAVDFDDRLYRMDEYNAINRAVVSKWGIRLGSATIFFRRHDAPALRAA
jgi:hypothetical protein